MTRQELQNYRRVLEIIRDQTALEDHQQHEHQGHAAIEFSRANAYSEIVKALTGRTDVIHAAASLSSSS